MGDGVALAKAYLIGVDKADQTSSDTPAEVGHVGMFDVDALTPPYDPAHLCRVFESSSSLRQNVDAYKTNIDGFGHIFEPLIELRDEGAREAIADAIYLERGAAVEAGGIGSLEAMMPPTDEEIDAKISDLRYKMRFEKARVESFFSYCVAEESFTSLRRKTREDLEVTGNGYWEVIRNDANVVSQFAHMPSRSVRVLKTKSNAINVEQKVRVGTLMFRSETYKRKFRRYAQIGGDSAIYFKEFGDTTIVSGKSGKSYATVEQMQVAEEGAVAANEVFHFKIHSLKNGAYGVPRWIGNLLSVLGSRSAEEVNLAYFDNKSIPPMAILVSGGRLGEESVKRIQDFVEVQIKGKKNFHKILVIEAETSAGAIGLGVDNAGTMRIEIKQLTDAQLKDGLFLQYDAANMDKVGMGFRMPRILRGDIRDFNRASAEAALDFAESQVFVPERNDFDATMNRFILPVLNICYWRFKSLGPRLSDSQSWGEMIVKLTLAGILTPADAREIAGKKVLSHELPVVKADWVTQPIALTIAGVPIDTALDGVIAGIPVSADPANLGQQPTLTQPAPGVLPAPGLLAAAKSRLMRKATELLQLRDAFRNQEAVEATKRYQAERVEDAEEIFRMSADEIEKAFGITRK